LSVRDGTRTWVAARQGPDVHLACLTREADESSPGPIWNEIPAEALPAILAGADRPSLRREAALEILRRKRDPRADLKRLFDSGPSPELAESLVSVVSGLKEDQSLGWLVELARSGDPNLQVPAFLALGGHPAATNHPVFSEIGSTTVPEVTVAILEGMRRSRSQLAGAGELALALTVHPDPRLAEAARSYLVAREEFRVAFAALDRTEDREKWPGAFAVLSSLPRLEVVEGLIVRLGNTGDPDLRRGALESLCRLYFDPPDSKRTWAGTDPVDQFLKRAIGNHRVNRPALIAAMFDSGIPAPDGEALARLARSDLTLDTVAVDSLLSNGATILPETGDWLALVATDESRDSDLRLKARALLARHGDYRRRFAETARSAEIRSLTGAGEIVGEAWLSRSDHAANLAWLLSQTRTGTGESRQLAWRTLLMLGERGETPSAERDLIEGTLSEALTTTPETLLAALGESPLSVVGKVIAAHATDQAGIVALARERSLDLKTGAPVIRVAELPRAMAVEKVLKTAGDPDEGRRIFRTLDCGLCHNVHGEGPVLGPDLSLAAASLSETELVEALLAPEKRIAPGFEMRVFEENSGRQSRGWSEDRKGGRILVRDRAWNRFEIPEGELLFEWIAEGAHGSSCAGADGAITDVSDLIAYLRSLKN